MDQMLSITAASGTGKSVQPVSAQRVIEAAAIIEDLHDKVEI
jgi:hypothetical protein